MTAEDVGGERFEVRLPLAELTWGEEYRRYCEPCPHFRKNLGCPPQSPLFDAFCAGAVEARVLCMRLPTATVAGETADARCRVAFRSAAALLREELLRARAEGLRVAGAGPCTGCPVCALARGDAVCAQEDLRLFSLESMGVDVAGLAKRAFGLALEWGGDQDLPERVVAIGAVLLEG